MSECSCYLGDPTDPSRDPEACASCDAEFWRNPVFVMVDVDDDAALPDRGAVDLAAALVAVFVVAALVVLGVIIFDSARKQDSLEDCLARGGEPVVTGIFGDYRGCIEVRP